MTKVLGRLSVVAQAVLGCATIMAVQAERTDALIADVRAAVPLPDEVWARVVAELRAESLAWVTGDDFPVLDRIETLSAMDILVRAPGAGGRPSAKAWARLREIVWARDFAEGDVPCCAYCGVEGEPLVLDHRRPVSRGGSNHPANLLAACVPCNSAKGNKSWSEWYAIFTARQAP